MSAKYDVRFINDNFQFWMLAANSLESING